MGNLITSDRLIPECADRAVQVYKNNGMKKKEIPAPMNEGQRQKAMEAAYSQTKQAALIEQQKKEDHYLLVHFANEQEIYEKRKLLLDLIQKKINEEAQKISKETITLQIITQEQRYLSNPSGFAYDELKSRAEDASHAIKESTQSIRDYHAQELAINEQYEAAIARFRLITMTKKEK